MYTKHLQHQASPGSTPRVTLSVDINVDDQRIQLRETSRAAIISFPTKDQPSRTMILGAPADACDLLEGILTGFIIQYGEKAAKQIFAATVHGAFKVARGGPSTNRPGR